MGLAGHVDGISRSRGWDKKILHGVLPMEKLVLSDKWARMNLTCSQTLKIGFLCQSPTNCKHKKFAC